MTLQHCKTFMIRTALRGTDNNSSKVWPEVSLDFLQPGSSSSDPTGKLTRTQLYEFVYVLNKHSAPFYAIAYLSK